MAHLRLLVSADELMSVISCVLVGIVFVGVFPACILSASCTGTTISEQPEDNVFRFSLAALSVLLPAVLYIS